MHGEAKDRQEEGQLQHESPLHDSRRLILQDCELRDLQNPERYFQTLLDYVRTARSRIILSALYLGTGPREVQLVEALREALLDPLRPDLTVTVILDHSRAQRGAVNSLTLLSTLVEACQSRVHVCLYQVPQLRSALAQLLPGQLKEVLGVYHCKFGVFDESVLLSGANLSEEYFVSRQDRYILIPGRASPSAPSLATYLGAFSAAVTADCHELQPDMQLRPPAQLRADLQSTLLHLSRNVATASAGDSADSTFAYPLIQHGQLGINHEAVALTEHLWTAPFTCVLNATLGLATPYSNYRSSFLKAVLSTIHKGCAVQLTVPSVPAHGFGSARGIKGAVPSLHHCSLMREVCSVLGSLSGSSGSSGSSSASKSSSSGSSGGNSDSGGGCAGSGAVTGSVQTQYYMRKDWTFHTKGMWLFPAPLAASLHVPYDTSVASEDEAAYLGVGTAPVVTYLGSSNFGERSWTRDFELGFLIVSGEEKVQGVLKEEYARLLRQCGVQGGSGGATSGTWMGPGAGSWGVGRSGASAALRKVPLHMQYPEQSIPMQWILHTVARVIRSFL
ncbi:hypothetical protein B484DRAFT_449002 [Ochromonadaceae sp. CCMP2298]|nr:hypothetical protein B484DRAFT_449002 [Ochromonadaceae sp. CCMP2298]